MSEPDEHDEDHPHEIHLVGPFPMGPNREEMERMQMVHEAIRHDMFRLFDTADSEQLHALVRLFDICSNPENGTQMADHYQGVAMGILHVKHNICLSCGSDHDKEANDLANRPD